MSAAVDVTDFDSDDEGEVPPLLGPGSAATPTVPSKPSTAPKKVEPKKAAAASNPAIPAAPPAPKPGANLKPSSGLKKGFLGGGGGGSARTNKSASASSSGGGGSGSGDGERVPMVRADVDAKAKSLQLPEVQSKMEAEKAEAAKLGGGGPTSWMTPELLKKIAMNPMLRKGFMDPRCQQAMGEMQSDPSAAMKKYGDNVEMRTFLQAFMKLMGEHFTGLADKEEAERKAAGEAPIQEQLTPQQKKAQEVAQSAMADPEVREIVADPKMQEMLAKMQSGVPFEVEAEMRKDPDIVRKLRKMSEAGLINMEFQK